MEYTAKNCFRIGILMSFASSVLMTLLFNVFVYGAPAIGGQQNTGTLGTAQTGIRFTKYVLDGPDSTFNFVLHYPNRDVPFSLATAFAPDTGFSGAATETFYYVPPGKYSITEIGPRDPWVKVSDTCESINVVQDQITSCTITNSQTGLYVYKNCVPPFDGASFQVNIQGPTSGKDNIYCGSQTYFRVNPGTYTVSETSVNDADLNNYTTTYGGACNTLGQVTLEPGEYKVCTITNTNESIASLTFRKICVPGDDEGKFFVRGSHNGTAPSFRQPITCGKTVGPIKVASGKWLIFEYPQDVSLDTFNDYIISYGGDCDTQGNVVLAAGDNKTCTITNSRKLELLTPLDATHR